MPRMGGPAFVEKLRLSGRQVAVIYMTGYTDGALLENAKIRSNDTLLNKPFSNEQLANKVSEILQRTPAKARAASSPGS